MRDRHHNVFYYFRGPSKAASASEQEEAEHQQVEDNTTKALINVLEHGAPDLTASFLARFVPYAAAQGRSPAAYFLQRGPDSDPAEPTWMLGLSVLGELDPASISAPDVGGSRIDAAVQLRGSALVLIEVKVVEYLDYQQLCRHAKRWRIPVLSSDPRSWPADGQWKLARWADVYRWARDALAEVTDSVSRFLLQQFAEYLELVGLAPFNGFREEHFEFFDAPPAGRSWATQSEIKTRLRGVWEAICEALTAEEVAALGEIHTNPLGLDDPNAVAQANWESEERDSTNISIELTSSELQVNLVAWTVAPARMLEAWFAPDGIVGAKDGLDAYELVVFRRRPSNYDRKGTGKSAQYRPERRNQIERADQQRLSAVLGQRLQDLRADWRSDPDEKWEKLAYHVRRAWPRAQVVKQGVALIPELVESIRELIPVVQRINRGRYPPSPSHDSDGSLQRPALR